MGTAYVIYPILAQIKWFKRATVFEALGDFLCPFVTNIIVFEWQTFQPKLAFAQSLADRKAAFIA